MTDEESGGRRFRFVRALIIFLAAVLVSLLTALSMIGFAALTGSLAWSVIGTVFAAIVVSWALGFVLCRRNPPRRLVLGPILVLGCAAVLSLSWLYPRTGGSIQIRSLELSG